MKGRLSPAKPPANIPPYGVLAGRMIFIGGLVLALLGIGFLIMLGVAGGSVPALILFGAITVAGGIVSYLAVRDLTGQPQEQPALVTAKQKIAEGGNPVYELKFLPAQPVLKNVPANFNYHVTENDWKRFEVGDRVLVRYSAFFKLLVDIRSLTQE